MKRYVTQDQLDEHERLLRQLLNLPQWQQDALKDQGRMPSEKPGIVGISEADLLGEDEEL